MHRKPMPERRTRPSMVIVLNDCCDTGALMRILPRVPRHLGGIQPTPLGVSPYDSGKLQIGFVIATTAADSHLDRVKTARPTVVLGNSAPRPSGDTVNCKGCDFVFAPLPGGLLYFGTFGPELSFVRPWLKEGDVWSLHIQRDGTPFRSRFLADVAGRYLRGDETALVTPVPLELIPPPPKRLVVCERDAQGNLKLGRTVSDPFFGGREYGQRLTVVINGVQQTAIWAECLSARGEKGDLVLAPGSSNHSLEGDPDQRFVDLYANEGHAAGLFLNSDLRRHHNGNLPDPGDAVELEWLD